MKYKRILLKLSGEALQGSSKSTNIDPKVLEQYCDEIKAVVDEGVELAIVIGGGNSKNLKELPVGTRRGHNIAALSGGLALWETDDEWVIAGTTNHSRKRTETFPNGQTTFN